MLRYKIIIMKIYLFFFFFIFSSLEAQIAFRVADSVEIEKIQNSMIIFYTKQLMRANLFENEKMAREAAQLELDQDQLDQDQLDQDKRIFYFNIISEDEKLQYGYLVYSIKDQSAYLDAIYLRKKYQGQGLGKQILHHFHSLLLKNDVHVFKLYVFDHNKRAIALYNKIGYEIETTYYINDKPIGHHMKKNI